MKSVPAKSGASAMTEAQLRRWRQRGESEKRVMFLFFSVLFSAIVLSVLLLSVRAFPAPAQTRPTTGALTEFPPSLRCKRQISERQVSMLGRTAQMYCLPQHEYGGIASRRSSASVRSPSVRH